ncbi:AraC family transcriptional regulator [Kitasatospora sp. NPDC096147]|uniref:AraC family transcriptional regulator n=1 Tax=Kitasatospora sp. NPDC096147 TaxID=3364093 RepID=UPI0038122640
MHPLTSLLQDVRSDGALFSRNLMDPPWSVRFADEAPLTLVAVERGTAWVVPDGAAPVAVGEGDVVLLTGAAGFTAADRAEGWGDPLYVVHPDRCTTADGGEVPAEVYFGLRTCGTGPDGATVLLTGGYRVDGRVSARLLGALPRALVVRQQGPGPLLELAAAEIGRDDPGQQAVLDRLLDLLLLSTLREWFARPEADPPGWYLALGDQVTGPALRLLHERPDHPWTVTELARAAGVSRATFARRFTELVGRPPMTYLTDWRLSLAADLLARTDATVESIAHRVGYRSAFALSAAFHRVYGTRPSDHRAGAAHRAPERPRRAVSAHSAAPEPTPGPTPGPGLAAVSGAARR